MPHTPESGVVEATPRARPLYFDSPDGPLFGWYHAPSGKLRDAAVVICPPFGVEAVFAHRALRHVAERLAAAGFAVLRFDYRGTGDSPGHEESPGLVNAWRSGIRAALDAVRALSGAPKSAIVGMRLGVTLAGSVAANTGDVDSIAMWAPIVSGRRYARELRAFSQTSERSDSGVGGMPVQPETLAEIEQVDLAKLAKAPARRALIISRDDLPDDGSLANTLTALGVDVKSVAASGYADAMVEPHNTVVPEAVIDAVSGWLVANHPVLATENAPAATPPIVHESVLEEGVVERPAFLDAAKRLFGVVSEPQGRAPLPTAIVLVNAGAVSHIGPHRFYVTLARDWAAAGFRVLRMDIGGIGESRAAAGAEENHTYPKSATSDVIAGVESLRKLGAKNVVVVGLCSGAHASYHLALERTDRTDLAGVVMINPIVFYWKPGDALDVGAWQNYVDARRLQRVVRTRDAWTKLLRGQVNLSSVTQTFISRLKTVSTAAIARATARLNLHQRDNLARDLVGLVERPLDVAIVFSNGDPGHDQLELQAKHVLGRLQKRPNFSLAVVPDADHTFTPLESQRRVREILLDHLKKRFS